MFCKVPESMLSVSSHCPQQKCWLYFLVYSSVLCKSSQNSLKSFTEYCFNFLESTCPRKRCLFAHRGEYLIENQQQVVSITEDDHRRVQLNNTNLQSLQQCPTLSNNNIEDWKQKESQSLERVLKELKNGTFEISCWSEDSLLIVFSHQVIAKTQKNQSEQEIHKLALKLVLK